METMTARGEWVEGTRTLTSGGTGTGTDIDSKSPDCSHDQTTMAGGYFVAVAVADRGWTGQIEISFYKRLYIFLTN